MALTGSTFRPGKSIVANVALPALNVTFSVLPAATVMSLTWSPYVTFAVAGVTPFGFSTVIATVSEPPLKR